MLTVNKIIKVAVSKTSYGYDKLYSYRVFSDLADFVQKGIRVLVPFGNANRKRVALILEVGEDETTNSKIKPIVSIIDEKPLINDEMIEMIFWLKETTMCTYYEAFKTIIPSGLSVNFTQKYMLTGIVAENLTHEEQSLYDFLIAAKNKKEFDALLDTTGNMQKKNVVKSLLDKEIISESDEVKRKVNDESIKMVRISDEYLIEKSPKKFTTKQRQVVDLLEQNASASIQEVCYMCNVSPIIVKNLSKKNILSEYEYKIIRPSVAEKTEKLSDIILSEQQIEVFEGVTKLIENNEPKGALLYGITGSGKTSVFVKLIEQALNLGKQAIMLIPEIALTPQMVLKFENLFGETVAVIHSNLSLSQRLNEYKRIQSGQAKIVVGTRSAIFSPLDNIGIIIMDEEGERSYKSESSPRYHARDIARKRCATHNAVLLMASATPSIESYFYAVNNRYELFQLTERYAQVPLPYVEIVDMGSEVNNGNSSDFSDVLVDEINYNLENKEQTILLLNRRGYNTFVSCPQCREPIVCPKCSIPLTYHKANGQLMCHYCGFAKELDKICPSCGNEHLKLSGVGTQKIEDEIQKLFPSAKVLRMDTDTTYSRYAYEKNFTDFANQKYDILVGTQMIAKGLDFPNVTLVGVLSVDKALFAGDFRSYERTFSLITQVVGRSGRGDKKGRAFLQTYVPEHYVLNLAAKQDYVEFFEEEIALRKALTYTPFCDIFVIGFSSLIEKDAEKASRIFMELMRIKIEKEKSTFPLRALGPTKCVYGKINGKYRYRIILKCKNTTEFRRFISEIYYSTFGYKDFSNVNIFVDINGDIGL
ncbi:MAG: primosomal protein N' [Oscillospiraceae bacterium]